MTKRKAVKTPRKVSKKKSVVVKKKTGAPKRIVKKKASVKKKATPKKTVKKKSSLSASFDRVKGKTAPATKAPSKAPSVRRKNTPKAVAPKPKRTLRRKTAPNRRTPPAKGIEHDMGGNSTFRYKADSLVVEAYAGTGKTFMLIMGLAYAFAKDRWAEIERKVAEIKGLKKFKIVPSKEQKAVWDQLCNMTGVRSIAYVAFNKSIVNEFASDWGWLIDILRTKGIRLSFQTINAMGNSAVRKRYGHMEIDPGNTEDLLADYRGLSRTKFREHMREDEDLRSWVETMKPLVKFAKLELLGVDEQNNVDFSRIDGTELLRLMDHYEILPYTRNLKKLKRELVDLLEASRDPENNGGAIDFDDQNWLPVVNKLSYWKNDLLLIDECQDLNKLRQRFLLRAGRQFVLVGDTNQAIYGFAGADVNSIPNMKRLLAKQGSVGTFSLTETRRCGKMIVEAANETLKHIAGLNRGEYKPFKAHKSNGPGAIFHLTYDDYMKDIRETDMVLCRVTAPLISGAMECLKNGVKATVRGREFSRSLQKWIKEVKCPEDDMEAFIQACTAQAEKETKAESAKKRPSDSRLMMIQNRLDCMTVLAKRCASKTAMLEFIALLFSGKLCPKCKKRYDESQTTCRTCYTGAKVDIGPVQIDEQVRLVNPPGVTFSTMHQAKGLESNRVAILIGDGPCPHPMAKSDWQYLQEWNLKYVAETRAKEELIWVEAQQVKEDE